MPIEPEPDIETSPPVVDGDPEGDAFMRRILIGVGVFFSIGFIALLVIVFRSI